MIDNKLKVCALGALYGGEKPKYFKECLNSIERQTIKIPIVLVIDGEISYELEKVLDQYKDLNIRIIRNPLNEGLSKALQLALDKISNEFEYAIRFDSDDINENNRFEIVRDYLNKNNVDLLSSHMNEIDENGKKFSERLVPIGAKKIKKKLPYRNPFNHPASAYRISSVIEVGGYKEMSFFEDWYLWVRMINAGFQIHNIDDHLVSFRATEDMIARRYGFSYIKNEAKFFFRRSKENLINPFENWLAFALRISVKLLGFKIYKKIFFFIRK